MFNGQENGLKGQYIIAQGKRRRSVALGWSSGNKIVRAKTFLKEKILFRTKQRITYFPEIMFYNSLPGADMRPQDGFLLNYHDLADGFSWPPFTQGVALGSNILAFQAEYNMIF